MELGLEPSRYSAATLEKDIREFFRAERKRLGLSQEEVAAEGGIEQSTVSKIERDAPYQPSAVNFLGAIRGLGMKASEFFGKFEQSAPTHERDTTGQSEKTNVRLLTDASRAHNVTPAKSQGALDAVATLVPSRDADIEKLRFALREAGTILIEAGITPDAAQPVSKTRSRAAKPNTRRHRINKTHSRKRSA